MELRKEYSNASDVNLKKIPSDVYGIIATILLREAAKQNNNTTPIAAGE